MDVGVNATKDDRQDRAQDQVQDLAQGRAQDRGEGRDDVAALLAARVSEVIAAHPRALELLVGHGFSLLAQAPLRRALAPTVTLAQALRIRGLGHDAEAALLRALDAAGVARAVTGARCP